eukprot:8085647-Ditylum_brightwellii.AAC.1
MEKFKETISVTSNLDFALKKQGSPDAKLYNAGKPPLEIPELTWLSGSTHRTKIVVSCFFDPKKQGKKDFLIDIANCFQLFSLSNILIIGAEKEYTSLGKCEKSALAPIEHFFDNH